MMRSLNGAGWPSFARWRPTSSSLSPSRIRSRRARPARRARGRDRGSHASHSANIRHRPRARARRPCPRTIRGNSRRPMPSSNDSPMGRDGRRAAAPDRASSSNRSAVRSCRPRGSCRRGSANAGFKSTRSCMRVAAKAFGRSFHVGGKSETRPSQTVPDCEAVSASRACVVASHP